MSNQITPNPSVPSQVVQEVKFPKFVNNLGIIPTSYKDSMDYYQNLAWLCKYLEETVIPTVNENGEATQELQGLYVELNSYVTNYFDNLDVQEEINNKLDDLVENGTLLNIIKPYLEEYTNATEELSDQVDVLESRISNIIADGQQTSGNTELIDIRTEFNGTVASTAGDAVREQVKNTYESNKAIMDNLTNYKLKINVEYPFSSPYIFNLRLQQLKNENVLISSIKISFDLLDSENIESATIVANGTTVSPRVSINSPQIKHIEVEYDASAFSGKHAMLQFKCKTYSSASVTIKNLKLIINDNEEAYVTSIENATNGTITCLNGYENSEFNSEVKNILNSKMDKTFSYGTSISNDVIRYENYVVNLYGYESPNENWYLSNFIEIPATGLAITKTGYVASSNSAYLIEYDENYHLTKMYTASSSDSDIGSKIYFGPTQKCKYIKVLSNIAFNKYAEVKNLTFSNSYGKEDYQSGYIFFDTSINVSFDNTTPDIETCHNVLRLPISYSPNGKPVKLAVVMHGAGGVVYNNHEGEISRIADLVDEGYAILDSAGKTGTHTTEGSCAHMGGPVALECYRQAINYVIKNYNVETEIYLLGWSMGGLTALNYANMTNNIKAICLLHPVTDLYNQAWLHPWFGTQTKIDIAEAYNFDDQTGSTYEDSKVIGYNPINTKSVVINNTRYNSLNNNIFIIHGDADETVSLSGTQSFVTALKNYGIQANLKVIEGLGHTFNDTVKNEMINYVNKF